MKQLIILICFATLGLSWSVNSVFSSPRRETPLVKAIQRAKFSVVDIHTEKTDHDALFGLNKGKKVTGMGAGIVVDPRGYILTNYHVVADVDNLEISLVDGKHIPAKLVTFDREADLALIKVDGLSQLQVMPMGTSSDLMLGETVIAVGNPYGYVHTITSGIVSYISRDVEVNETQKYFNLIQTDASINPGNSGGPLLNVDGEVIGINVAIRAGAQRIGFAIPIDDARKILAKLISTEVIEGTTHGLNTTDDKNGENRQLKIDSVSADSPAAQAGLQSDDIITSIDQEKVVDRADLERLLLGKADSQIQVKVKRGNEDKTLTLKLVASNGTTLANVEKPSKQPLNLNTAQNINNKSWNILGVKLSNLPEGTSIKLPGKYKGGLVVTEVRQHSPAAFNGIKQGDILVGLHVWETVKSEDVNFVIDHADLARFNPLRFYILRNNETLYGDLKLSPSSISSRTASSTVSK